MPTEIDRKLTKIGSWMYSANIKGDPSKVDRLYAFTKRLVKETIGSPPDDWMPVKELARQSGVHRGHLVRLCREQWKHQRKAEMYRAGSRVTWHIDPDWAREFLKNRRKHIQTPCQEGVV